MTGLNAPSTTWFSLGRVTLAPGDSLTLEGPATPLIIAIAAGRLDVVAARGRVWAIDVAGHGYPPAKTASFGAGEGGYLTDVVGGDWRAEGEEPLVAWVLAVEAPEAGRSHVGPVTP